ncbi:MAG TPA: TIGR03435 family protein [Bryobacteraceae bacterium]|nr:TIGR03435 family protein [Bryobacteraceae bacterium]
MRWLPVLLLCGTAAAQTGPVFNAASVNAAPKDDLTMATKPTLTARRLVWQTDLFYLNSFAWNIPFNRVDGIHGVHIVRIEATTNHDATVDEMRQMMRNLLATRFKQKAHIVSKNVEGAALTLAKDRLKVKEVELPAGDRPYVNGTMPGKGIIQETSHHATIDELAQSLGLSLHQPVWNRTGVTGNYDYTFRYAMDDDPSIDAPSLENALRDTLGITLLKKQRGPVDFLVIDSMETDPGEN